MLKCPIKFDIGTLNNWDLIGNWILVIGYFIKEYIFRSFDPR
jgi:hypothetical protein